MEKKSMNLLSWIYGTPSTDLSTEIQHRCKMLAVEK
jgi:hypothetical protein